MYSAFCCRVPDRRAHWKWIPHSVFYTLVNECENLSVGSCSLQPCGLCSPWNSPGQNTGMGSLSLLQGILLTQESNSGVPHCGWILYQLSYQYSLIPRQSPARSPGNRLIASWNTLLLLHVVPHLHTAQLGLVHLEISRF